MILCLVTIWAAAALYIDLPATNLSLPASIFYLVVVIAVLFFFKFRWVSLGIGFALFAGVALWWCAIQPSNNRDWQPEVAETAWTERDGDKITIHNLRNFDYGPGPLAKPRWETKIVDLNQLRAVDLYINFWGSTLICHPIVSFQFGPNDHVAISVETRMAKGQTYSTLRGFFKQFALTYIVADERDVIRVRTNYRHEQLYLYRTSVAPWDWRMLLNGTVDQLVYENGGFASHLPFAELKPMSLIDTKAQAADQAPEFSALIRAGLPGFDQ